ncbi:acyl-CoA dehydrogenase [Enemella sp. A6]|uniref:acyl-CoA dehydrogenase n=1 Tax=Enemella sp. A6 TaxID=3440152 RepID=UPI003EB8B4F8
MTHYRSNLRDLEFNLFEVFGREEILGTGPAEELDREVVEAMLHEVDVLSRERLADSMVDGDRNPPVYNTEDRSVTLPASYQKAFRDYMDAGWWRTEVPEALGGQSTPPSVRWALAEMLIGANPPLFMYASGPKFAHVAYLNGTERDKKIAQLMIDREWASTMVLTEPDAGSDVGAGRTKAELQDDGTWHLSGVKRFITSGEHDLTENIIHFVLARPVGIEGVGGPGTKGLSLFLVPKFWFDPETGELGERNGVYATNVEHKMGLKASSTCELTFGDDAPAKGWLLGEVHDGIAQMFQVIEYARMLVGTKAIATLSTGYLNALDYAKTRVQGADMLDNSKTAPRVTITHHPDVRRSLLTQKANAEALRSLVMYTASMQDRVWLAEEKGETDEEAESINDLLLPIVKGYGSERSWVLLGTECLQTYGGSGFLSEYPLEQYVRDAKIDTLYEGTTAIQGQDLLFRKIVRDGGRALGAVSTEITNFLAETKGFETETTMLGKALGTAGEMVAQLIGTLEGLSKGEDPRSLYTVGLNTTRLLMTLGDVLCAWLLMRGAVVAQAALDAGASGADEDFYRGKIASASWFCSTVLPKTIAEGKIAAATDLTAMDLPESAF